MIKLTSRLSIGSYAHWGSLRGWFVSSRITIAMTLSPPHPVVLRLGPYTYLKVCDRVQFVSYLVCDLPF